DQLAANLPGCEIIRKRRPTRWFSIMDLLVIISIIGMLIGMLVPTGGGKPIRERDSLYVGVENTDDELAKAVRERPKTKFCDLTDTKRLTDDGLRSLIQLEHLQTLDMKNCHWLTDKGLAHISKTTVETLNLEGCDQITLQGLEPFVKRSLPMRLITLPEHLRTDEGIAFIMRLPRRNPNVYRLVEWHISDKSLELLAKEEKATEITLSGGCEKVTEKGIAALGVLPELQTLEIIGLPITSLGPLTSESFRGLGKLEISGCTFLRSESLYGIEHLTLLESLSLRGNFVNNDSVFASIGKLPRLRNLQLVAIPITDVGLSYLGQLRTLTILSVWECPQVTGVGFNAFASAQSLVTIDATDSRITDEGAIALSRIKSIERLELSHNEQITDRGIEAIAQMPRLKRLELKACNGITDAALDMLAGSPSLKELDVTKNHKLTRKAIIRFRHRSRCYLSF
ncbi:MAG: hypothetical protein Q4G59_10295, partial [Planctomycetia bacterium]|nr:hypothetical protein [Planctomycetia bacterium]